MRVRVQALSQRGTTEVLLAYGRNRWAEEEFLAAVQPLFAVQQVPNEELDPVRASCMQRSPCVTLPAARLAARPPRRPRAGPCAAEP